jgi:hypothetical protein
MAADSSYVYVAGHVWVGYNKPDGPSYYFLDKYDRNGNQIWNQRFGAPGTSDFAPGGGAAIDDFVAGTAVGAGAVYIAVSFNRTSLLHKYDTDGNFQWTKIFGNLSSLSYDLSHVNVHRYIASVSTAGNRTFVVGTAIVNEALVGEVAGYDSDGKLLWATNLGSDELYLAHSIPFPLSIYANSVAEYIGVNLDNGSYLRKLDPNGAIQWSHRFDHPLDAVSGDAGSIYTSTREGFGSTVLSKFNPNGSLVWSVTDTLGDPNYDQTRVSISSSGVYMTKGGLVAKYDENGNRVWYVHPPLQADTLYTISANSDGLYVGAGLSAGHSMNFQGTVWLSMVGASSSLIIFGVGPPFSFIMVAALAAVIAASILW